MILLSVGFSARNSAWAISSFLTASYDCTLKHQTMAARGSYENRLTPEEESEKALDLIAPLLGKTRAQALLEALWSFDQLQDVRTLRSLYAR